MLGTMTRWLTLTLLLTGCPSASQRLCTTGARCAERAGAPLGDEEVDACVDTYEEGVALADEAGCGDEHDAFLACALKNAECGADGELEGSDEACAEELQGYFECTRPT
jgi:hypothetical protein